MFSAAFGTRAQDTIGDWKGTLQVGPRELRLVLHIAKGDDGNLKATLDSVDQRTNGIPVTSISLNDSKLAFTVDSLRASYEGRINREGTAIEGTWMQDRPLPLNFSRATTAAKTESKQDKLSDIEGSWSGTLKSGANELRIIFRIHNTEDGLSATLDSPDQNARGLPVTAVTRNGSSLKLELKQLGGMFEGKIDTNVSVIEGAWTQGGRTLPLVLKRLKGAGELDRPRSQNPIKPYPYREEDVLFISGD
jgi:hypothetical protein